MSYTIQYNDGKKNSVCKRRRWSKKWLLPAAILALAIAARLFWPQIGNLTQKLLFLGVSEQNEAAVTAFIEDVRNGEDFSDALTVFCREVLNNAETIE